MIHPEDRADDGFEPVARALPAHALEIVALLRDHDVEAVILDEIVPQTLHHYSGIYEVFVAVPQDSVARARELLAAREPEQERRVAELVGDIRRQLAIAISLTAMIMAIHGFVAGRWEWADLGTALWTFIAIVFLLGIAQRYVNRRGGAA